MLAYWRETGRFVVFKRKAVILATGGGGKAWRVTSNSWEYTGDGIAMAYDAGAELMDVEFTQFHPTGMVWPLSVRGILVTEGVRGDGGILLNNKGERFMFNYISERFAPETADTDEEADRWLDGDKTARRPPELLTRDEVARAITAEVKAGRGSPHGGVFLDIASRRPAPTFIKRKLPSMYHQFKELAEVDITKEPMEVGPTLHYFMGGIRVDADSQMTTVPGLFACGECAARHARRQPPRRQLALRSHRVRQARRRRRERRTSRALELVAEDRRRADRRARSAARPRSSTARRARTRTSCTSELEETMAKGVGIVRKARRARDRDRRAREAQGRGADDEGARREPVQPRLARGAVDALAARSRRRRSPARR